MAIKIGIVSDTHIPRRAKVLPEILLRAFCGVDHILHAGDISCAEVLEWLEAIAPVTAVAGNADPPELCALLGYKKIIRLGALRFGIFHGHGPKGTTMGRALECFREDAVDCIVFGHSHIPYCGMHAETLMLNPGSPTDKRKNPYFSFGIIEADETLRPRLVYFDASGTVQAP